MERSLSERIVYVDGEFLPESQAKISVLDHGFLYGDHVFEGIRVYNGRIFELDVHIDRLYESAKYLRIQIPLSEEELKKAVIETVRRNNLRDAYIRLIVTRGVGDLTLDPDSCPKPSIVIIVRPMEPLYGGKCARAIIASTRRIPSTTLDPKVKSGNYLHNILAKIEAKLAGVDEALMLNQRGFIAEGTGDNIFIVKDGKLITPPPSADILLGITRKVVMEIAKGLGIPVEERDITVAELYNADEAFLTGTAAEVAPLVEVDGRRIGDGKPGPITEKILREFRRLTRETGTQVYG